MTNLGATNEDARMFHARVADILIGLNKDQEILDLHDVMHLVYSYVMSSYRLYVNPLRALRRALPQFRWEFVQCKDSDAVRKVIASADLIWLVGIVSSQQGYPIHDLITATGSGEPRRLFFCPKPPKYAEVQQAWVQLAEGHGGVPVQ